MKLYLIAGEASGDSLGAALMAGLRLLHPGVAFHGVGGPLMQAQGLTSQFPMEELSVMGIAEVLPKYFALKARIAQCASAALALAPDALITIDSPDFCLRVARLVKAQKPVKTIHYVAPTVWAWRPGRAAKMAQVIDHVLALFPFEPPYMTASGMTCDFVGHPVVAEPAATPAETTAFRATHGIPPDAPVLLTLPGSRKGEVTRLCERFGETIGLLHRSHPDLRVIIPTVRGVAGLLPGLTENWPVTPLILAPGDSARKRAAFATADLALAASGTVSLELAATQTPMVIGYDMNWLSRQIIGRLLKVNTVTLVNLVSDTRTIPEFLGPDCQPAPMAAALENLMPGGAARAEQLAAMAITMDRLGQGGEAPGLRAARSVLKALG